MIYINPRLQTSAEMVKTWIASREDAKEDAPMLEWQDDRSKMALQLNLSCHELANDTKHAYVSSNATAAMDGIAQKEVAKEDASKDGMEAVMTKWFS